MRWEGREGSENVEDRRGQRTKLAVGGGIGAAIIALVAYFLGADPSKLLQQGDPGPRQVSKEEEELREFVGVVLKDTEDVWTEQFRKQLGKNYVKPKLVLYTDQTETGCGFGDKAVGPFYCPADDPGSVYIDLSFFQELKTKYKAPGDFAAAYVLAHEVGHHVQKLLGYSEIVHRKQRDPDYNEWSVRLELQADYLAGVWAHHANKAKNIIEPGDVEEAMGAAQAVGDDTLQRQATGVVRPDRFTHGSAKQRAAWFLRGLKTGKLSEADLLFRLPYQSLMPPPD